MQKGKKENARALPWWLLFVGLMAGTLAFLFHQSFNATEVLFANDGPLGAMKETCAAVPAALTGVWSDLYWIGGQGATAAPNFTALFETIFSPETYLKIYAPLSLFFVGFSAWLFFRQLKFNPMVCILGGVAAGLNMHFFSLACWGLGSWNMAVGLIFLALAALVSPSIKPLWAKAILAGLAVGLNLTEAFDCGAILSIYFGIFIVFWALTQEGSLGRKAAIGLVAEVLVVVFSAFIAIHSISWLLETQVKGVAGMEQDTQTKQERWDPSTQWSLPKVETLRVVIPGLFGYRLDQYITTPDKSSAYWGTVGQDPKIVELTSNDPKVRSKAAARMGATPEAKQILETGDPQMRAQVVTSLRARGNLYPRHTGSGEFAGVLVSLLALFGLASAWRRGDQAPFRRQEKWAIWFWGGAALLSLLASWGRHGFVYWWLYQLPYFSTIRNPIKFMHPFHIAWVILAGYGLEALYRCHLRQPDQRTGIAPKHLKNWWAKVSGFDKKWTVGTVLAVVVAAVATFIFGGSQDAIVAYLKGQEFNAEVTPKMFRFALGEAAWFVLFLTASTGVLICILSGLWNGARAKWAWLLLGVILILDLSRADKPWINYFDYKEKYSMNPVTEFLEQKPYEHRVVARLRPIGPYDISGDLGQLYHFWLQNDFPYHDIQCLDVAQMPRMPVMDSTFIFNFTPKYGADFAHSDLRPAARLWQLTNTRFMLAMADALPLLNDRADPEGKRFHTLLRFVMGLKPGVSQFEDIGDLTIGPDEKGPFALIEYDDVLPRAKLYSNWQSSGDAATLKILAEPSFNPAQTVFVAPETPVTAASAGNSDPGTVEITDYQPKTVKLHATAKTPAVLLLNDHSAPFWTVRVDEKPADLLRCNYIMRGVFLPPGEHAVEFRFRPPLTTLYISLAAWASGLAVAGYLMVTRKRG